MSTASYEFAQGGTATSEMTGGMSGTTFWVYAHTTVSNIKVTAAQKDINQDAYVIMVLTTSDGITTEETKQISGGRQECSFSSTLSVNARTWFNLTFYVDNSVVYYDPPSVTKYIATGWTGNGQIPAAEILFTCKFTITYDPIWTVDAQNDGYARIAGYTPPADWEGFEKDKDGYPTNWAAWKLDDQNEGYPWPTGYLPARIHGGQVAVFTANGLETGLLYVFTANGLVPATIPLIFT
jgi:hypothetical protein